MHVDVFPGVGEGHAHAVGRVVDAQPAGRAEPRAAAADEVVAGRTVVSPRTYVEAPVGGQHIALVVHNCHRRRRAREHTDAPGRRGRGGQQGRGRHEDWAKGDHFFKQVCLELKSERLGIDGDEDGEDWEDGARNGEL